MSDYEFLPVRDAVASELIGDPGARCTSTYPCPNCRGVIVVQGTPWEASLVGARMVLEHFNRCVIEQPTDLGLAALDELSALAPYTARYVDSDTCLLRGMAVLCGGCRRPTMALDALCDFCVGVEPHHE